MQKDNKLFLIALSITCVIFLYSTIALYVVKESERTKKAAVQRELDDTLSAKRRLESALKDAEIRNAEMKARISSQNDRINMLSRQFEDEKASRAQESARVQEKEAAIQALRLKLEESKLEKEDMTDRLAKMNEEYLNLKFQLENILKTKEEIERRAKEMAEKEGISLGTIVVKQR